jgi:peptide/nickel transport system permease protein
MDEREDRQGPGRALETIRRRPLARCAWGLLALLYGSAVFAPLIANDRPYSLHGIDTKAYREALSSLSAVSAGLARLAETSEEDFLARRGPRSESSKADALAVEERAALGRLETLESWLPRERRTSLDPWKGAWRALQLAAAQGGTEDVRLAGEHLIEVARKMRVSLQPRTTGSISADGVQLVPRRSWPIFESLYPLEVGAMAAWFSLMTLPFVLRRRRGAHAAKEKRGARRLGGWALVLFPVLCAGAWAVTMGAGRPALETSSIKSGLIAGDIVVRTAPLFPPLPYGYAETHSREGFLPPSWASSRAEVPLSPSVRHAEPSADSPWRWLAGTDSLGRDLAARMLWGGRVSLSVGLLSAALLTFIGALVGALAGYFGGWVDFVVLRLIEVLQSIPAFFLVLLAMAFTDPRVVPPVIAIVVAIACVRWTGAARLVRGEFLRLREREFVLAARALGFSDGRLILRHLLPNALGPLIVHAAFAVAVGILIESAISFLGFGIRYPEASWGTLITESRNPAHWWIQLFPGLLIFLTVTSYNLVGDALRDALDPKSEP